MRDKTEAQVAASPIQRKNLPLFAKTNAHLPLLFYKRRLNLEYCPNYDQRIQLSIPPKVSALKDARGQYDATQAAQLGR